MLLCALRTSAISNVYGLLPVYFKFVEHHASRLPHMVNISRQHTVCLPSVVQLYICTFFTMHVFLAMLPEVQKNALNNQSVNVWRGYITHEGVTAVLKSGCRVPDLSVLPKSRGRGVIMPGDQCLQECTLTHVLSPLCVYLAAIRGRSETCSSLWNGNTSVYTENRMTMTHCTCFMQFLYGSDRMTQLCKRHVCRVTSIYYIQYQALA